MVVLFLPPGVEKPLSSQQGERTHCPMDIHKWWYLSDGTCVLSAASPSHPPHRCQTIIISTSVAAYLFGDAEGGRQSFVYTWVCKSMNMSMRVSVKDYSEWETVGWMVCVFRGLVGSFTSLYLLHILSYHCHFTHVDSPFGSLFHRHLMILVKVKQGLTLFNFIHQHYYYSLITSVYSSSFGDRPGERTMLLLFVLVLVLVRVDSFLLFCHQLNMARSFIYSFVHFQRTLLP